jgi:phosphomannomutase/phosphoglucomutase
MDPKIFRAYDIRGIVGSQIPSEAVEVIARALGTFFDKNGARQIAVGHDARESSPLFCEILIRGLRETGRDVMLIGQVPSPVLYHTVHTKPVDGGVMITGSHNPADHNGFKICLGKSTLFGSQIREIREIAEAGIFSIGQGSLGSINLIPDYIQDIGGRIKLGARKLKVVVDAGNGMGGVTAVPVFRSIGAEVVELFTEPDSRFPNHHPDPTVEENLSDLIDAVRSNQADIGIAFDGDGDRIGVVDEQGGIIWGDELMVLYSRALLAARPGATILGEVKCSQNLFDDIERHGGKAVMATAGHSLIKAKMKETGALLAGELSGHIFFADRFYGFDDATYAGCRILEILSNTDRPLSALLSDLPKRSATPEIRIACPDEVKFQIVAKVKEHYLGRFPLITIDGARIDFGDAWGLVRASNTQPMLVLRFEAETPERLASIRTEIESYVNELID